MDPSKRPRRTRPLLKPLILICGIMASLFPGVPFAFFGVLGLAGGLADAGYAFNLRFGLAFLGIAVVVWGLTFVSYLWCVDRLPTRFSMRSLFLAMTAAAVGFGTITALVALAE